MRRRTGTALIVVGIVLAAVGVLWLVTTLVDAEPHSTAAGVLISLVAIAVADVLLLQGLRRRRRFRARAGGPGSAPTRAAARTEDDSRPS